MGVLSMLACFAVTGAIVGFWIGFGVRDRCFDRLFTEVCGERDRLIVELDAVRERKHDTRAGIVGRPLLETTAAGVSPGAQANDPEPL